MKVLPLLLVLGLTTGFLTEYSSAQTVRISRIRQKQPLQLDWFIQADDLWTTTPDQLETKFGARKFVWQDKERTRARFNPDKWNLTMEGENVGETLVTFKNGKMASVTISVLNKGDDDNEGLIDLTRFNSSTKKLQETVSAASGVKPEDRRKDEMVSKGGGGKVWRSKKALYMAEWLFLDKKVEKDGYWTITSPAHGEYVRLRILPPMAQLGVQSKTPKVTVSRSVLASHVKREGKKAIIEGIPMVDQGSKGYCAVASFERVLRLYGVDLDMHDLANLAETYGGTSPIKMKEAVFKVAQKLGMNTKEPIFYQGKQYESLFKEYNKVARKSGKTELNLETGFGWDDVDPEVLKQTRLQSAEYKKFRTEIVDSINKGIPVMWALRLGLFWEDQLEDSFEANRYAVNKEPKGDGEPTPEQEKQEAERRKKEMEEIRKKNPRPPSYMGGGHMRLIIGYDADQNTIYYTDSWGPGNEMKSMSIEQAYTATLAMFIIAPQ